MCVGVRSHQVHTPSRRPSRRPGWAARGGREHSWKRRLLTCLTMKIVWDRISEMRRRTTTVTTMPMMAPLESAMEDQRRGARE